MRLKFLWVLIIPKWLIKVPGHIVICFGTFLELREMIPNMDPDLLIYYENTLNNIRTTMDTFLKNLICVITGTKILNTIDTMCTKPFENIVDTSFAK